MFIEISFTRYQECFTGIINQMYFQHNIPIAIDTVQIQFGACQKWKS